MAALVSAEIDRCPEDVQWLKRVLADVGGAWLRDSFAVGQAVRRRRSATFVQVLLDAGAPAGAHDARGDTPLLLLLKRAGAARGAGPRRTPSFTLPSNKRAHVAVALKLLRAGARVPPGVALADDNACSRCVQEYDDAMAASALRRAVLTEQLGRHWLHVAEYLHSDQRAPQQGRALRGINIQWPFSQLILQGVKSVECRRYPLGRRGFALPREPLWLIETPGPSRRAQSHAETGGVPALAARPTRAQVVGVVSFQAATRYVDVRHFKADAPRHRIRQGSRFHWRGDREMFGWRVATVSRFAIPVQAGKKQMIGWTSARRLA